MTGKQASTLAVMTSSVLPSNVANALGRNLVVDAVVAAGAMEQVMEQLMRHLMWHLMQHLTGQLTRDAPLTNGSQLRDESLTTYVFPCLSCVCLPLFPSVLMLRGVPRRFRLVAISSQVTPAHFTFLRQPSLTLFSQFPRNNPSCFHQRCS